MQRFQKKHVGSGSGFHKEMFAKTADLFESEATRAKVQGQTGRIVNLSWDATGYKKKILFNSNTGK